MNKLDLKDMERFAWDAMAPGIENKIQKKKAAGYLRTIVKVGVPVLLLLNISVITYQRVSETINLPEYKNEGTEEILENYQDHTIEQPEILLSDEATILIQQDDLDIAIAISDEADDSSQAQVYAAEFSSSRTSNVSTVIQEITLNNDQPNLQITQNAIVPQRVAKSSPVWETNSKLDNKVSSIANHNPLIDEVDQLSKLLTPQLKRDTMYEGLNVSVEGSIENSAVLNIQGIQTVETSFGTNYLLLHPGTSILGTEVSLGYRTYVDTLHYIGFGFDIQKLNFNTIYPSDFGGVNAGKTSNNNHRTYSLQLYYGYTLERRRLMASIEAGVHFNFMKFSEGKISAVGNPDAFIDIMGDNYFATNFGLSFLLRARVEYLVTPNMTIFTRPAYRQAVKNWYKADNFTIKPGIINLDIGVSRRF